MHVAANEYKGELIFLHKVKEGAVDDSYGIQVAKLANLPDAVISRAQVILDAFEKSDQLHDNQVVVNKVEVSDESSQSADDATNQDSMETVSSDQSHAIFETNVSKQHPEDDIARDNKADATQQFEQAAFELFDAPVEQSEIEQEIKALNLSNMTPIDALVKLSELQKQLK